MNSDHSSVKEVLSQEVSEKVPKTYSSPGHKKNLHIGGSFLFNNLVVQTLININLYDEIFSNLVLFQ